MTQDQIDFITEKVVENIKQKYFLTEKTFNLTSKHYENLRVKEFIENVIFQTCKNYNITREKLIDRHKENYDEFTTYAEIRYIAMDLCRNIPEETISLHIIGEHFGGRDHTSVLYGINKIKTLKRNIGFLRQYNQIERLVNESLKL